MLFKLMKKWKKIVFYEFNISISDIYLNFRIHLLKMKIQFCQF